MLRTIYPMVEWGITELQAGNILKERGLHNPLYNYFDRTGCWLCPKQSLKSLTILKDKYPELYKELEEMDIHYTELGAESKFKGVGVEVINEKLENKSVKGSLFEEPLGCFCK